MKYLLYYYIQLSDNNYSLCFKDTFIILNFKFSLLSLLLTILHVWNLETKRDIISKSKSTVEKLIKTSYENFQLMNYKEHLNK